MSDGLIWGGVVLLVALGLIGATLEGARWEAFKSDHHCTVVGKTDGQTNVGFGMMMDGKIGAVTTFTPGRIGWLCDDGVTYWK